MNKAVTCFFFLTIGLVHSSGTNETSASDAELVSDMTLVGPGNYYDDLAACRSLGKWPLSIHNWQTNRAAFQLCETTGTDVCYIGLRRSRSNNGPSWYYDDGTAYDFSAWDDNQPQASEMVVAIYTSGNSPYHAWHDWGLGYGQGRYMICGPGDVSQSPQPSVTSAISPSSTPSISVTSSSSSTASISATPSTTATVSVTPSSTTSPSMSASNTPGVCRPYCVGEFGYCQQPLWEDYTCYPHDALGNCPVNTVSCPNVVEADTVAICVNCAKNTTGPCQHAGDGRCEDFKLTGVCAPNLVYCGSALTF